VIIAILFKGHLNTLLLLGIPIAIVSAIATTVYTKIKIKYRLVRYALCLLVGLILFAIAFIAILMFIELFFIHSASSIHNAP
jgi:hypothetical protein